MVHKALLHVFILLFQNLVCDAACGVSEDKEEGMVEQAMLKLGDDVNLNLEDRLKNLEAIIHQQQTMIADIKLEITLTKEDLAEAKKKILNLELEKDQHQNEEEKMAETAKAQASESKIQNFEIVKEQQLSDEKKTVETASAPASEKIAYMKDHRIEKTDTEVRELQNKLHVDNQADVKDNTESNGEITGNKMTEDNKLREKRQTQQHVAFSAFLSHSVEKSASSYTIILDRILINDGLAYNPVTGVFTAPVTGTYLFTFHIHNFNSRTVVKLVLWHERIVDAIADTPGAFTGTSASNTAILHVTKGQQLWLETYIGDGGLNSGFNWRYVTFSGVLLY